MTQIAGVILAGGQATRMGGQDKGMMRLGGVPLIERVIARLSPQCATLAISANGDLSRFADFGYPVFADGSTESQGPLAGVLAGLDWAARTGFEAIVTVATDTPFFPTDLVDRLQASSVPEGFGMAVTEAEERRFWHPTFALWPVALRDDLRVALRHNQRRMRQFAESKGVVPVVFEKSPSFDPFFNINTETDLARAEALLASP